MQIVRIPWAHTHVPVSPVMKEMEKLAKVGTRRQNKIIFTKCIGS